MIAARAAAAQDLYDAGIGFFPMRGNHETTGKVTEPPAGFQSAFPQTQGAGATYGATDFTSPVLAGAHPDDLKGLSYSFDYGVDGNDARFVIIDPFATLNMRLGTAGNQFGYPLSAQQAWIDARLDKATRSTEHASCFRTRT